MGGQGSWHLRKVWLTQRLYGACQLQNVVYPGFHTLLAKWPELMVLGLYPNREGRGFVLAFRLSMLLGQGNLLPSSPALCLRGVLELTRVRLCCQKTGSHLQSAAQHELASASFQAECWGGTCGLMWVRNAMDAVGRLQMET